ncbi:hypothetical protein [Mucisphaera sp.]|uniref:hypothetical protein n=1 Tax=Mucisphaera sp. TaxID=2913024 RepID=UPI003D14382E
MQTPSRIHQTLITMLSAITVCILTTNAHAQFRPGWEALPEETVAVIRMPSTQAFIDQLRDTTALGKRILTDDRLEQIKTLITEENPDAFQEFVDNLEEAGFTPEDLITLATSNWGLAIVAEPRDDQPTPRWIVILWADIEEEMSAKLLEAYDRAFEENNEDATFPSTRIDFELAGYDVRQVSWPEVDINHSHYQPVPPDFQNMDEQQMREHWQEQMRLRQEAAEPIVTDMSHMLLTQAPGRMIVTIGMPQLTNLDHDTLHNPDTDWEALTDVQTLHAVTARYLAAMEDGAEDPFVNKLRANREIDQIIPEAGSLFEIYADLGRLIQLLTNQIENDQGPEQAEMTRTVMSSIGFDNLGMTAITVSLNGQSLNQSMFISMPEPRAGILEVLGAVTLSPIPSAWVPADIDYAHIGFDLALLYDVIVETATEIGGMQAEQQIAMGNGAAQGFVQADIRQILASLGTRHTIVASDPVDVMVEDFEYNPNTDDWDAVMVEEEVTPVAFVWDLTDQDIWQRIMTQAKTFLVGQPGAIFDLADQQGFSGIRTTPGQNPEMAVMLGNDRLVYTVGPDITDRVIALLNNPPQGDAALANSELYRDADNLINFRPAMFTQIADSGQDMVESLRTAIEALDDNDDNAQLASRIKALLPSEEDLEASFGVNATQITLSNQGLLIHAEQALPIE